MEHVMWSACMETIRTMAQVGSLSCYNKLEQYIQICIQSCSKWILGTGWKTFVHVFMSLL